MLQTDKKEKFLLGVFHFHLCHKNVEENFCGLDSLPWLHQKRPFQIFFSSTRQFWCFSNTVWTADMIKLRQGPCSAKIEIKLPATIFELKFQQKTHCCLLYFIQIYLLPNKHFILSIGWVQKPKDLA